MKKILTMIVAFSLFWVTGLDAFEKPNQDLSVRKQKKMSPSQRAKKYFEAGQKHWIAHDYEKAGQSFARARKIRNKLGKECLYFHGISNLKVGDLNRARKSLKRYYIRYFPCAKRSKEGAWILGNLYEVLGKYKDAYKVYHAIMRQYGFDSSIGTKARNRKKMVEKMLPFTPDELQKKINQTIDAEGNINELLKLYGIK